MNRTASDGPRRWRGERGQVGGIEALPFGFLIFVAVTLLVANAWAVLDAHQVASTAAREATRAAVEAPDGVQARRLAMARARSVLAARDHVSLVTASLTMDAGFVRCGRVTTAVRLRVPAMVVPWLGGFGRGIEVLGRHSELIDPYRDGLDAGSC